jgi:hypothetical protein
MLQMTQKLGTSVVRRSLGDWLRTLLQRLQFGDVDPGAPFWERLAKTA